LTGGYFNMDKKDVKEYSLWSLLITSNLVKLYTVLNLSQLKRTKKVDNKEFVEARVQVFTPSRGYM
jgi:hypothetical protein